MPRGFRSPRMLLLFRGLLANRNRPNLGALARESRPERFVWRVLPHAARSFSASIVVLPAGQARAAAVAYLYCRMLDTYEDLHPDLAGRVGELRRFAARFDTDAMPLPPPIPEDLARDQRDRLHLLLVERCHLVDAVFRTLPVDVQGSIRELVRSMSEGMAWSTEVFARQGGVLVDEDQVARYCRNVIGNPALFVLSLVVGAEPSQDMRRDALAVSEMVQLANVTRDIESDLARGVAYHPALKPYLRETGNADARNETVRQVREEFLGLALRRVSSYRRLFEGVGPYLTAAARMAAVLMLLFTDLHYRGCAVRSGHEPWSGPRGPFQIAACAAPAAFSHRWARHVLRRIEGNFLAAAGRLGSKAVRP